MASIGFASGCLNKIDINFEDALQLYLSSGADIVEIHFSSIDAVFDFKVSNIVKKFSSVSIHLPEYNYGNNH